MKNNESEVQFTFPGRGSAEELATQRRALAGHPLVRQLLDGFPEPAMILNAHRQIVVANDKLAALMNRERDSFVGLRPGEALGCIHSSDPPAGCGTTAFCKFCGTANAIGASQRDARVDIQECRITRTVDGAAAALDLRVWATPLRVDGEDYTVFAMRDTTGEKRRAVLERLFFHDVLNSAGGLKTLMEIWPNLRADELTHMTRVAQHFADAVVELIQAQLDLTKAERGDLEVTIEDVDAAALLAELCALYAHHAVARGAQIDPPVIAGSTTVCSDAALLRRVLGNLIKNAVEASHQGQTVSVAFDSRRQPVFRVHNESAMSDAVRAQVFQRSFSTKDGNGRGVGCYSVKLLTETYLGGSVTFSSTPETGTTFTVQLPSR